MRMTLPAVLLAASATLAAPAPAHQPERAHADRPATATAETLDEIARRLTGSFEALSPATDPAEDPVPVRLHCTPVRIEGLPHALYFEVSRADDPAHPFRQGIFALYTKRLQPVLRVLDFTDAGVRKAVVALWAAPDAFPPLTLDSLRAEADLVVSRDPAGAAYTCATGASVPTTRGGAVEMSSTLTLTPDAITTAEIGLDAQGNEVWRTGGERGLEFRRIQPSLASEIREGGVIVIDLLPGDGPPLEQGGEAALHYSQFTLEGIQSDTSRLPGRPPVRARFPTGGIKGLDIGMLGLKKNARRRIIIPPPMGWGDQARGTIPPDSTLVFDVEALWIGPPPAPSGPENGDDTPGPIAPPVRGGH